MRSRVVMFLALLLPLLLSSSADADTAGNRVEPHSSGGGFLDSITGKVIDRFGEEVGEVLNNVCSPGLTHCDEPWGYCDNTSHFLGR